ncbi:MAG TPA: phytanoyl-CoA dioxygenase family protein [Terriglobales bacterium]|nr:phytanoyl-CoA dioxygenase family protein [Terriglobales bacterium]
MSLSDLKHRFDLDGYVVVRNFLNGEKLGKLRNELDRYITTIVPALPRTDVFYENRMTESTLKQMAKIKEHDSWFSELISCEPWIGLAKTLLDDEVVPRELEWFNKPPRIGKPTPPHQDGFYFMLEPNEAVTMWLALDPADESNGCVRYIPGSHKLNIRPHQKTQVLGFSQGISDYGPADFEKEVPMIVEPGDLLVHHALTIHRADGNESERDRRSLGMIYFAKRARQDSSTLSAYQENLYAELEKNEKI